MGKKIVRVGTPFVVQLRIWTRGEQIIGTRRSKDRKSDASISALSYRAEGSAVPLVRKR